MIKLDTTSVSVKCQSEESWWGWGQQALPDAFALLLVLIDWLLPAALWSSCCYYLHFTGQGTEAQEGELTHPKSHSEQRHRCNLGSSKTLAQALSQHIIQWFVAGNFTCRAHHAPIYTNSTLSCYHSQKPLFHRGCQKINWGMLKILEVYLSKHWFKSDDIQSVR